MTDLQLSAPVDSPIIQGFGADPEFYSNANLHPGWSFPGHNGIDYSGFEGMPVKASANGILVNAFEKGGFGNYCRITHENGWQTYYAHLASAASPAKVVRGQVVGFMGSTGCSTGVHLHFGLKILGAGLPGYKGWVDPAPYLASAPAIVPIPIYDPPQPAEMPTVHPNGLLKVTVTTIPLNLRQTPGVSALPLMGSLLNSDKPIRYSDVQVLNGNEIWVRLPENDLWFAVYYQGEKYCIII